MFHLQNFLAKKKIKQIALALQAIKEESQFKVMKQQMGML